MVFHEERVLGKDRALLRFLDIGLERHQPFFSALIEKVIHGFEKLDVALFGELRASEDSAHARRNLFKNMERVGDQHGSDSGAADDEKFRRLKQDAEVPMLHQVPANYCAENHDNADDDKHKDLIRQCVVPDSESSPRFTATARRARSSSDCASSPGSAIALPTVTTTDTGSPHQLISETPTTRLILCAICSSSTEVQSGTTAINWSSPQRPRKIDDPSA